MTLFQRIRHLSGIDAAVAWTAAARVWTVFAGPLTLVLIASHLTPDEQGFYYAFSSIVGLQVFFDLGLAFVIQQFASHEKAFLHWQPDGTIGGSESEKRRLAALLQKALQWYGVASALMMAVLLIGASWFFARKPTTVGQWREPWMVLAVLAGAALFLSPLLALLGGCGRFADVARIRAAQAVLSNVAAWLTLLAGGRLWASPVASAAVLLTGAIWLALAFRVFFRDLLRTPAGDLSWREEVWPFQWRIALSWISGYFVFQLFTPVLFATRGPAAAGRMGMSVTAVLALITISTSWLTAKVPDFGQRIARRDFAGLDALFFGTMWRSLAVMAAGCTVLFAGVLVLRALHHPWGVRLLDPLPLALLLAAAIAQHVTSAQALYLRAHKSEPLLGISILYGLLAAASTIVLGRAYGPTGMMAGLLAVTLTVSLGGGTWIFVRKRREWHQ